MPHAAQAAQLTARVRAEEYNSNKTRTAGEIQPGALDHLPLAVVHEHGAAVVEQVAASALALALHASVVIAVYVRLAPEEIGHRVIEHQRVGVRAEAIDA